LVIIYGYIELLLPHCSSLKEKRKIIQSIISRIRKRFNISISEIKYHDLWQRTIIGFTAIGSNKTKLELFSKAIEETLDKYHSDVEIMEFYHDIISQKI